MTRCRSGLKHWFAYYGMVGSSSPACVRYRCEAPNPRYRPTDDPYLFDRLREGK